MLSSRGAVEDVERERVVCTGLLARLAGASYSAGRCYVCLDVSPRSCGFEWVQEELKNRRERRRDLVRRVCKGHSQGSRGPMLLPEDSLEHLEARRVQGPEPGSLTPIITWNEEYDTIQSPRNYHDFSLPRSERLILEVDITVERRRLTCYLIQVRKLISRQSPLDMEPFKKQHHSTPQLHPLIPSMPPPPNALRHSIKRHFMPTGIQSRSRINVAISDSRTLRRQHTAIKSRQAFLLDLHHTLRDGGSFDAVPQTLSADSVAQDGDGAAPDAGIAAFDGDEVEGGDDLHVEEEG
jgi:hypothetical protein